MLADLGLIIPKHIWSEFDNPADVSNTEDECPTVDSNDRVYRAAAVRSESRVDFRRGETLRGLELLLAYCPGCAPLSVVGRAITTTIGDVTEECNS